MKRGTFSCEMRGLLWAIFFLINLIGSLNVMANDCFGDLRQLTTRAHALRSAVEKLFPHRTEFFRLSVLIQNLEDRSELPASLETSLFGEVSLNLPEPVTIFDKFLSRIVESDASMVNISAALRFWRELLVRYWELPRPYSNSELQFLYFVIESVEAKQVSAIPDSENPFWKIVEKRDRRQLAEFLFGQSWELDRGLSARLEAKYNFRHSDVLGFSEFFVNTAADLLSTVGPDFENVQ